MMKTVVVVALAPTVPSVKQAYAFVPIPVRHFVKENVDLQVSAFVSLKNTLMTAKTVLVKALVPTENAVFLAQVKGFQANR